ncbi:MAG: hypothetical protein U0Q18_03445 [Bryobacteraceae bacterium]
MRKVYLVVAAAAVLGVMPLLGADSGILRSIPNPDTVPFTESLGMFASTVTMGHQDPALPCFNCVQGAAQINLGLAVPLGVVRAGTSQVVVVTGDDVSYSGPCTFSYSIQATPTSAPIQTGSVSGSCSPSIWLAYFPMTVPSATGRYVLQGQIQTRASKTTVYSPLVIAAAQ